MTCSSSHGLRTKLAPRRVANVQSVLPTRSPGRGCQFRIPNSSPSAIVRDPSHCFGSVSFTPKRTRSETTPSSARGLAADCESTMRGRRQRQTAAKTPTTAKDKYEVRRCMGEVYTDQLAEAYGYRALPVRPVVNRAGWVYTNLCLFQENS